MLRAERLHQRMLRPDGVIETGKTMSLTMSAQAFMKLPPPCLNGAVALEQRC